MNAYAGDYDLNIVWTEDHFDFSKSGVEGIETAYLPEAKGFDLEEIDLSPALLPEHLQVSTYPNPFNPTSAISYQLSALSFVNLSVYDISGRKVTELVNGQREAGLHEAIFDASNLPSGLYIYRLQAGDFTASGKMILMK